MKMNWISFNEEPWRKGLYIVAIRFGMGEDNFDYALVEWRDRWMPDNTSDLDEACAWLYFPEYRQEGDEWKEKWIKNHP